MLLPITTYLFDFFFYDLEDNLVVAIVSIH